MKIFIAMPTYKYVEPEAHESVSKLFKRFPGLIHFENQRGSPNIYQQHSRMCETFLKGDWDYYLWHDSDQEILTPDDWLERMIDADKPIISPLIVKKLYPNAPACISERQHTAIQNGEDMPIEDYRKYGKVEPFENYYCCGGVVLIKREVLESIDKPFYPALDDRGFLMGVDISMYSKAKKLGYNCWIEPSIVCGHLGKFSFLPVDYYSLIDQGAIK